MSEEVENIFREYNTGVPLADPDELVPYSEPESVDSEIEKEEENFRKHVKEEKKTRRKQKPLKI